jgi:hypothetical protein
MPVSICSSFPTCVGKKERKKKNIKQTHEQTKREGE